MGKYITRVTYTNGFLPIIKSHDTYDEARKEFHENIGIHIMDDDAGKATFTIDSVSMSPNDRGILSSTIDTYTFKGFAPPREEKDPNRPFNCPNCETELDLFSDVEQWSRATIVYTFAGDSGNGPEWERDREDIDEYADAHRVYCRYCGDTMPLDDWNEAYEKR